jgi:hypothetical protein
VAQDPPGSTTSSAWARLSPGCWMMSGQNIVSKVGGTRDVDERRRTHCPRSCRRRAWDGASVARSNGQALRGSSDQPVGVEERGFGLSSRALSTSPRLVVSSCSLDTGISAVLRPAWKRFSARRWAVSHSSGPNRRVSIQPLVQLALPATEICARRRGDRSLTVRVQFCVRLTEVAETRLVAGQSRVVPTLTARGA